VEENEKKIRGGRQQYNAPSPMRTSVKKTVPIIRMCFSIVPFIKLLNVCTVHVGAYPGI
jgi:hypothetical protein